MDLLLVECGVLSVRKLSPGGYEYLTGSVACADRELEPGESLSDYYLAHGYPPGQWFGAGAAELGMSGEVTAAQMNALFGEGRHPDADRIEAEVIAAGASHQQARQATKLGSRFLQYGGADSLRSKVTDAYKAHNLEHRRPVGAPIDEGTRTRIRRVVQRQAYAEAHDGQLPTTAEMDKWLAEQKRELKSATSGYELVLAPPKSVSVAWGLAGQDTRELIVGLHRQAVTDTLTYLESNVAFTRKGAGGYAQHDVTGITAAIFEHWDSRAGDMHLHTHVPIAAKVQGSDGRWTSLDGRTILAASVTMSEYYNSRIRDLLREHGASWTERPSGGIDLKRPVWELDGVPNELLAGFSQRAAQVEQDRARRIVAFRNEHGREPTPKEILAINQRAQHGTRDAKQAPQTLPEHRQRWRAAAGEMVTDDVVDSLTERIFHEGETVSEVDTASLAAATRFTVSDHFSHFNKWNIEAEAHRQTAHLRVAAGTRDQLITGIVDAVVDAGDTITLQAPALIDEPNPLLRSSGESVFVEHNAGRFTTHKTLREESALVAWGNRYDGYRASKAAVNQALAGQRLNSAQEHAVAEFARSRQRVQLLMAPAGTGKTTTMRAFAEAWRTQGARVFAFGPSARAAQELGQAIDAPPHTLDQVTTALRAGGADRAFGFTRGDVLIVDEAAMAGTHTLHDVLSYALKRGADVRLVGDDKQLAAVGAGGAIRLFAQEVGAVHLREVVRFADRDQAAASLQIREGNPDGLDYYFEHGQVHGGSRETIRDAAHHAWRTDLDRGRQTLLIVPTNEDVAALNLQARALRIHRGAVASDHSVGLHDGTAASTGDWVVTRHNDRLKTLFSGKDFVKNGDTWTVVSVRDNGALKVRHRTHGAAIVLPADYVAEHVELAYASTVNRVQGMTAEGSAHGMVPQGLTREQLYTLITRARHENRLYVETHKHTIDSGQETPPECTARSVLETTLTRSSGKTSATEELRTSLAASESVRTLLGHHDYVAHLGAEERIEQLLARHTPALLDHPAAPALRQTLATAEDLGWQAEQLVPAVLATGTLDGSDDPAAVLQWRIQQRVTNELPPERSTEPTQEGIHRWRGLIGQHNPTVSTDGPGWDQVWGHAAAGAAEGFDADSAITTAARQLAARPRTDPVADHDFLDQSVIAALNQQRADGAGWHPAVPWMAHPQHTAQSGELDDYLQRLNTAIGDRVTELSGQVAADPPHWAAQLGARPPDSASAQSRWDHIAGLAAAYRETYNITSADPSSPLGSRPDGHGPKARAWDSITDHWRPPVTRPHDQLPRNQDAINALRDQIERHQDYRDDTYDEAAAYRDEASELRHDRHDAADEYRYDDELTQSSELHSGLGY